MPRSAKSIAEAAMPGWVAVDVNPMLDGVRTMERDVDTVGVDFDELKTKYFGSSRGKSASGVDSTQTSVTKGDAELVVMEPAQHLDSSPGRKTVLVKGDKVIGVQG